MQGEVISLNQQMKNFEEVTLGELVEEVGRKREEVVKDYMFVVGTGGNDYSLNYFLNPSNANVSLEDFTSNLTNSLSRQLEVHSFSIVSLKYCILFTNLLYYICFSEKL